MKVAYRISFFLIVIFQFISCDKKKTDNVIKNVENNKTSAKPVIAKVSNEVDTFSFPVDSTLQVKILQTETFIMTKLKKFQE